jgi:hypothetical protein
MLHVQRSPVTQLGRECITGFSKTARVEWRCDICATSYFQAY